MIEIEAKMQLMDRPQVEARLRELGATLERDVFETNTFFDTGEGELKSSDQGLRVRVEVESDGRQRVNITHKGPRAHGRLKSRSETEVAVADARAAGELLGALGYVPVLSFEKRRRRWLLDGCRVEVDTLPHIGDFIEIEGPSDESVLAVRAKLDMQHAPLIKASYISLLKSHLRENNQDTDMIRFPAKRDPAVSVA